MNLDSLDCNGKAFITTIVDAYIKCEEHINAGTNKYFDDAGIQVHTLFVNFRDSGLCNVSFHKTSENNINVCYTFSPNMIIPLPDEKDYDALDRYVNIERVIFIYKISLLKWLYDSNYIFLIDDKSWDLFNANGITEHDRKNWEKKGVKYYEETLKSNTIFEVLSKFNNCRIIPCPELIYYRNHGYKTLEQKRYLTTRNFSWIAIGISILIGIGSPWLMTECSKTSIESTQLETILNAIPKQVDEVKLSQKQMDSIITILNKGIQTNNEKIKNAKP